MAKDLNNKVEQDSLHSNDEDTEKSFVGKFKSIISNTPLSKWFRKQDDNARSTIRRRDEENDEEITRMQPPAKRAKFPDSVSGDFSDLSPINSSDKTVISEIISKTYNHFPEPAAGPSGVMSRKLLNSVNNSVRNTFNNDLLNGHKDSDSEESTSGYSSVARIGSKEHVSHSEGSSKQPSPLQTNSPNTRSMFQSPVSTNRSLFTERTASPNLNTSLSSRRPCFNASTFGSPNFIDNTISTEKIINSPFYNGTTIYGGASAYGSKLGRNARDLRATLKRSVHIKPVNKTRDTGNLVLGKTARKILETLEQYSTPVNDAKKIPIASKRFRPDNSLLGKHIGVNSYVSAHAQTSSNKELQVPTVSDLLKMKQKAKLQTSTEAVRQIAISSQSNLNAGYSKLIENTSENNQKISEKPVEMEKLIENVKESVPNVKHQVLPSLPISTVPKFDLNIPSPISKKTTENVLLSTNSPTILPTSKPQNIKESRNNVETNKNFQKDLPPVTSQFKFSNPLIIAEDLKSIVAMNNFKFSEPLSKTNKVDSNINVTTSFPKSMKDKNNGQNIIKGVLPNPYLDKFKPATGTWECGTCLIRNQPDKTKCIACDAINPKLKPAQPQTKLVTTKTSIPFGDKFNMPDNMWECSVCMIRNSNDSAKCQACETPNSKPNMLVSSSSPASFQNKFQPAANTWECSTCLIRNKEELNKCAACESPKISKAASSELPKMSKPTTTNQQVNTGIQLKFPPPANTWECSTCLIRNKEDLDKCAACSTSRIIKSTPVNQLSDLFKIKDEEWECTVCLVRNKSNHAKCQCCEATRPGTASSNIVVQATEKKPAPKFNFGIDQKTASSFSFGIPPSTIMSTQSSVQPPAVFELGSKTNKDSPIPTFSFGVTPKTQVKEKPIEITKTPENKITLSTSSPSTAIVKPVTPTEQEKTETKSTLFKSTTNTPIPSVASKTSNSPLPATVLSLSKNEPTKPSFNIFDAKVTPVVPKVTPVVSKVGPVVPQVTPEIPKFEFGKPTNSVSKIIQTPLQSQNSQAPASTPVFAFGSAKPVNSTPPMFGQKLPPVNNGLDKSTINSFGVKANTATSAIKQAETKPFSFTKSDSEEPATKAPMFNFGQSAGSALKPPATHPSGFNFGQVTKSPMFNFSASKTETPVVGSSGNLFSGSNTTGNAKNGIFNFGGGALQNAAPQRAGFNFGTPSVQPPTSGFNFGAATAVIPPAPSASTGGFNFTAAFDANAKPTFNFSDSPVTFSAQPTAEGGMSAPRKIKKAVRRTR